MLRSSYYIEPSEIDQLVFDKLVPEDHLLCRAKAALDFQAFGERIKDRYHPRMGRPAEDPVRMIKLGFLQFLYNLSDREVLKQTQVNVAFRYFLDLSLDSPLPTVGLLSQFRTRLGEAGYRELFEELIAQARAKGLVKDRLRLKDATHVIANIAIPSAIQLVAQTRTRLLRSAKAYAKERVAYEEEQAAHIRQWTDDLKDEVRLLARVAHLRQIVAWADELQHSLGEPPPQDPKRQRFDQALALAHRILDQNDHPDQKDKTLSVHDPDARRGKHGDFYDGYQLDLSLDADSELITQVDTPPANHDEAANAENLIEREEQAQGNDVAALSMDGIGFRGEILRTLKDPQGLGLAVYVPPREWSSYVGPYFTPADFHLEEDGSLLVCPAEEETRTRHRNSKDTGWKFSFKRSQCQPCPLLEKCMAKLPSSNGRTVVKNEYEAEYRAARELAQTQAYAQVRQEHPKVERKLAEIVRFHGGRRTRYRGGWRVAIQYLLTAMVVNLKRMVKLLWGDGQDAAHLQAAPS
jgi:transposase